jgi:capsular polysaccharide biosynthesis protein
MNAQTMSENAQRIEAQTDNSEERTLVELALPLMQHWKLLLITPLLAAGIGFGATYVVEPTFTAQTTLLPL